MIIRKIPLHNRSTAIGRQDSSKKSGTGQAVKSAMQAAPGGFSAKTLCLSRIPEYCPGTDISAGSAFFGLRMRFLLNRLYFTFRTAGFREPQSCHRERPMKTLFQEL